MSRIKAPDISETTWLGATLAIGGWIVGLIGLVASFWQDKVTLLAAGFGISMATAIAIGIINGGLRRRNFEQRDRIAQLEVDLKEARQQAGEWSMTSNNVSSAALAMIRKIPDIPVSAPVRIPRPTDTESEANNAGPADTE